MNRKIVYLVLLFAFGCNPKGADKADNSDKKAVENSGWEEEDQVTFLENCQQVAGEFSSEKAETYCTCLLDVVVEKYPVYTDAVDMNQREWEELIVASDCHSPEFEEAIAAFWGKRREEAFKAACKAEAVKGGSSEEEAENFCSCALEQVKDILPNPQYATTFTQEEWDLIMKACE